MNLLQGFELVMRKIFPSSFTIAIVLTLLAMVMALFFTSPISSGTATEGIENTPAAESTQPAESHLFQLIDFWYKGLWDTDMLAFAVQMMLILVLGYVLASTSPFQKIMECLLRFCSSTARSAFLVTLTTVLLSFFNWGLGLIFGAIFARKVAEYSAKHQIRLNYPLIAAAGYSGLMVWHGGISGSAPLKIAETGHFLSLTGKSIPPVDMGQTVFSPMNLSISFLLVIILPLIMYYFGKKEPGIFTGRELSTINTQDPEQEEISGAEKIDFSKWAGISLGIVFLIIAGIQFTLYGGISVINPNFLNFILLGLSILLSGNIARFLYLTRISMGAASGILIQFPLYFGILGIMRSSGLVEVLSEMMIAVSDANTFPVLTFISAAVVNVFVPSGGGQWAVQGPIIVEAAQNLGIPLGKAVMALAYGDELTNMLQPFWALPLLGITGLKARDIVPYTLTILLIGLLIFTTGLIIF